MTSVTNGEHPPLLVVNFVVAEPKTNEPFLGLLEKQVMSTKLPFECDYVEPIDFEASKFCFTGHFNYGKKKLCQEATRKQGGTVHEHLRRDTDYLVAGAKGNGNYANGTYGRKIEYANELKADGFPIKIISENDWARSLKVGRPNRP